MVLKWVYIFLIAYKKSNKVVGVYNSRWIESGKNTLIIGDRNYSDMYFIYIILYAFYFKTLYFKMQ